MLDYVAFTQRDSSRQRLWDFSANLSGGLFELPGGTASIAIGVEHRDQIGPVRSRSDRRRGPRLGHPRACRPRAAINVNEAYAELRLPLLRDTAFFHRLELTGAARYSDYSTSGSTTTFSAGINWEPIEDLLFRGSWAEGFRAPSIGELFGTPSRFDQEIVDPCSGMSGATPANVRTNCIADGVPANNSYVQLNAQLPVVTGGNPTCSIRRPAESWGFGMVWRPSFLSRRLSLEANYYNIKVDGAIRRSTPRTLLGRCAADRRCAELRRDRPLAPRAR